MESIVRNSKGEAITLNAQEKRVAAVNQKLVNALGYEVNITTLTTIIKKVSEQKFFQLAPADYVPIRVGQGAWSSNLITYRSFALADDFSTGVINTGANNGRLAQGDAGVDSVQVKVLNWAKSIGWSLPDLQLAAKSGSWDLVTSKEKARKKNWDLGIQKVAFLGLPGDSNCLGLFSQVGVTIDLAVLTQSISSLAPAALNTFIQTILNSYRSNCGRSAWPSHFIIPESDYLGLAAPSSPTYPIKSVLSILQDTFAIMTGNKDFKVLPCAYGDKLTSGATVQQYVLLNYEEESLRMDIPVDYTNTVANSIDNFSFQNVGYGQFTGVMAYRPQELYYIQF